MAPAKARAAKSADLAPIFDDAQRGFSNHRKNVRLLQGIQKNTPTEAFRSNFVALVNRILVVFKREPAVERLVEFVASFATLKSADGQRFDGEQEDAAENNDDFAVFLMRYLLHFANAKDKAVRFRVCQIVGKVLNGLGEDAEIDEELWEAIQAEMFRRLRDRIPVVRMQALHALERLQNPADADCPVMAEFVRLATRDSSPDVRRAALSYLSLNKVTLRIVVGRMRDTSEAVRKQAMRVVADKVALKALCIADRVLIASGGLGDRADAVRAQCVALITKNWLRAVNNDAAELLRCLDVETNEEVGEKVTAAIVASVGDFGFVARHFLDLCAEGKMAPAEALLWRVLCEYHANSPAAAKGATKPAHPPSEERLEQLAPELSVLCDAVRRIVDAMFASPEEDEDGDGEDAASQCTFVARQLIRLAATLDMSDEVGRRNCAQLCVDLLSTLRTPDALVKPLVDLLAAVHPSEPERVRVVIGILDGIRTPAPAPKPPVAPKERKAPPKETPEMRAAHRALEMRIASCRIRALEARDKKEACIARDDFAGAAEAKEELDAILKEQAALIKQLEEPDVDVAPSDSEEEQEGPAAPKVYTTTPEVVLRCLALASSLFGGLPVRGGRASASQAGRTQEEVAHVVDTLVLRAIQTEDADVRNAAMEALGLACLLDGEFARRHVLLFLQAAQVDQEAVVATALKALFDVILAYGVSHFSAPGGDSAQPSLLPVLMRYLGHDSPLLRTVATEGFARLALHGMAASPQVVSHLLILFYNPTTEEDARLRQCLMVFFPAFAFASRANQHAVERALLPTVRTIAEAPETSPLATISPAAVAQFVVYLCGKAPAAGGIPLPRGVAEVGMHDELAVSLCNEILVDPSSDVAHALLKSLSSLVLSPDDQENVRALRVLCEQMSKAVKDKAGLRHVAAFADTLMSLDKSACDEEENGENAEPVPDATEHSEPQSAPTGETEMAGTEAEAEPKGKGRAKGKAAAPKKSQKATKAERLSDAPSVEDAIEAVCSDDDFVAPKKQARSKAGASRRKKSGEAVHSEEENVADVPVASAAPVPAKQSSSRPSRRAAAAAKSALKAIDNLVGDSD